jgi:hypothetical protein
MQAMRASVDKRDHSMLIVDTWQKLRIKLAEVKPEQGVDAAGTAT